MYYMNLEFHERKQCVSVRSRVWIAVKKARESSKLSNSVLLFSLVNNLTNNHDNSYRAVNVKCKLSTSDYILTCSNTFCQESDVFRLV